MLHLLMISIVATTFESISTTLTVEITRRGEILVGQDPVIEKNVQSELQCVHLCKRHLPCLCNSINILSNNYSKTIQCQILNFNMTQINSTFKTEQNGKHVQLKDQIEISDYIAKSSCWKWKESGCNVNGVYPILINGSTLNVVCDMQIDGGGWTVMQNRFDGSVNFSRLWEEYKTGFGDLNREFWLGNEIVHQLSKQKSAKKEFWVQGMWFDGNITYRKYTNFSLASEEEFYRISNISIVDGFAPKFIYNVPYDKSPDIMETMKFSTEDSDNDINSSVNCAERPSCGWWFGSCFEVNLNGRYFKTAMNNDTGIVWPPARGNVPETMKETRMMIR